MKISIITVCLNSEETIEQTIQSVISQNDIDYEYIIIDGGSGDGTLDIIEKYKKDISIVISEPDNGIYDAMNKGIALASGDVIGIINSDDWYEPGIFKIIRTCFQNLDIDAIYGRLNFICEGRIISTLIPSNIDKIRYEMEIPHPTVFIKKEIYDKYGGFQLKYKIASDYDLILRLYILGVRFYYQDSVFANFRLGGASAQLRKVCTKETLSISQKYLSYAPLIKRKYYKDIIVYRWKAFYFIELLENLPDILAGILTKKLGVSIGDSIAIFGAGKWGGKASRALIRCGFQPVFFVDNDREKWDTVKETIKVYSPEILRSFKGVLLLITAHFTNEILDQIQKIQNLELYCITWEEIIDASCIWELDVLLQNK